MTTLAAGMLRTPSGLYRALCAATRPAWARAQAPGAAGGAAATEDPVSFVMAHPLSFTGSSSLVSSAASQRATRQSTIWVGSRLGFLAGAATGAAWGLKRTIADDSSPMAIVGYTVGGAFAGLGVGALVGAVWPNRTHTPSRDSYVEVQPMFGRERGVRVAMSFR